MPVNSIDGDNWTTQSEVADIVQVQQQGTEKDYSQEIGDATDTVQSWYIRETDTAESDLPSTESEVPDLVEQAVAWEAASEAMFKFSQSVQNGDDANRDESFHRKAKRKFEDWVDRRNAGSEESDSATSPVAGKSGSLTSDLFGGDS